MKEQGLREYSQTQRASKGQLRIQKRNFSARYFEAKPMKTHNVDDE
jgi:hypothetical protein